MFPFPIVTLLIKSTHLFCKYGPRYNIETVSCDLELRAYTTFVLASGSQKL